MAAFRIRDKKDFHVEIALEIIRKLVCKSENNITFTDAQGQLNCPTILLYPD